MEKHNKTGAYEISLCALNNNRIRELPTLNLAYIGDTVYDLYIRSYLVKNNMGGVEALHRLASGIVNAKSQAQAAQLLKPLFTKREGEVFNAGKNSKSAPPKNMSREDYSQATGLEAVIGYLYLAGENVRLNEFFKIITDKFLGRK